MKNNATKDTITIPKDEYRLLKELHKTVKRQNFLLRIDAAERNLEAGKVKKVPIDTFIEGI